MSIELLPIGVKCNIQCPACYEQPMRDAGNEQTPAYDMAKMFAALEREGVGQPVSGKPHLKTGFTLFGGEPLLLPRKDLEQVCAYAQAKGVPLSVQTNGTLITAWHVELFQRHGVNVGVSVDGPDALNDTRWVKNEAVTRKATERSHGAIAALCAAGRPPSLIVTLTTVNASLERLPRLVKWVRSLIAAGVRHWNFHTLETDNGTEALQLSTADAVAAAEALIALSQQYGLSFSPWSDMARALSGDDDEGVNCIWHACDPLTTNAVRGVDGQGGRKNCGRVAKDGVPSRKADAAGHERQIALYLTPQEYGGCQGCRFFLACGGECYSDDTEVLTAEGFKLFRDVGPNDRLASMNPDTGEMVYDHPVRLVRKPYVGSMLHFVSKGYDLLVTPTHPMLAWDAEGAVHETSASEIDWRGKVLRKDAGWVGCEQTAHVLSKPTLVTGKEWCTPVVASVDMDQWLEFLGWFVSEGWTSTYAKDRGHAYEVGIGHNDQGVIERNAHLLRSMGFGVATRQHNQGFWHLRVTSKQLHGELSPLGGALAKHVPSYVKELMPRQIRIFLDSLFQGDGTSRRSGRDRDGEMRWECLYTSSRQLADDVQELLLKVGLSSSVSVRSAVASNVARARRGTFTCNADAYEVYVRGHHRPALVEPVPVSYRGEVFDVTMPRFSTVYVRRNGKTVWGHNCPGTALDGDWRSRTSHCATLMATFPILEAQLVAEGKMPISLSLDRARVEAAMLEAWGHGQTITRKQALSGQMARANSEHGDKPHGDVGHGDRMHGDHHDAAETAAKASA